MERGTVADAIRRALVREDGIALVVAISIMLVLAVGATTVIASSSAGQRSANRSKADEAAFSLAEGGLANAVSVLALPSNNALDPRLFCSSQDDQPPCSQRTDYEGGYAIWGGTLDEQSGTWTLEATGYAVHPDPAGAGGGLVHRRVSEYVDVQPSYQQPLNNMAWNYIWAKAKSDDCDMTIDQSVNMSTPLVVEGNLCLRNTATITKGPLVVEGWLQMDQKQNSVGSASEPINEAHIAGSCIYQGKTSTPCRGAPDNVYANVLDSTIPPLTSPTADWATWYLNASPGPYYPCITQSGTPPVFDSDQYDGTWPDASHRNGTRNLVPFNLTPSTSYSCVTPGGELSWDAAEDVLTVKGTVYIDGSAYITNGAINQYEGVGSLYLSGTFLLKNSELCAGRTGSGCDTKKWDPNTEMLVIVADGENAGGVPAGVSIQLVSATFQGALYATHAIENDTTSQVDGPMVGSTVMLGQTVNTTFPAIKIVPSGMPSNPVVYAQPMTPRGFSG